MKMGLGQLKCGSVCEEPALMTATYLSGACPDSDALSDHPSTLSDAETTDTLSVMTDTLIGEGEQTDNVLKQGENAHPVDHDHASSRPVPLHGPRTVGETQKVIIFDWDDTLHPTSFMQEVFEPYGLKEVTRSSSFYDRMEQNARVVESLLRAAREVAQVAIVTLASRPWVHSSATRFLPGLNIGDLCKELDICVYYASENLSVRKGYVEEEGLDMGVVAKQAAMNRFVKKVSRKRRVVSHIMSVGDSHVEAEALKEVVWSKLDNSNCTTVQLKEKPSLEELTGELEVLIEACPQLMCREGDAEINVNGSQDLKLRA